MSRGRSGVLRIAQGLWCIASGRRFGYNTLLAPVPAYGSPREGPEGRDERRLVVAGNPWLTRFEVAPLR
jgi:hypothetical protein